MFYIKPCHRKFINEVPKISYFHLFNVFFIYCDFDLIEQEVIHLHVLCLGFVFFFSVWPYPMTWGNLFPQLGIEPRPPALEGRVAATGLLGSPCA